MTLRAAPREAVGPDGQPRFGKWSGVARECNWQALAAPYAQVAMWRRLHHKRWHFVALVTDELFCGLSIVDIGWGNSAFAYAFDRRRRQLVEAFSPLGVAGLSARVGAGAMDACSFRLPGRRIELAPLGSDAYALRVRAGSFRIDAEYGGPSPRLLGIGPAAGGAVHATQKSTALALRGRVEAGGQRYRLDGGCASFDYSNGLLGHRVAWRWVSAHGPDAGINLQAGFFGAAENALWLDGQIVPLAYARMERGRDGCWRIRTTDGLCELRFTPEGTRRDDKQLVLASSRFAQHLGTFDGWVRPDAGEEPRTIAALPGLAEEFSARW